MIESSPTVSSEIRSRATVTSSLPVVLPDSRQRPINSALDGPNRRYVSDYTSHWQWSMDMYRKTLYAGWSDMDFNSHTKNTAYLDKAADVRQMFLIETWISNRGILAVSRIGPIVMKDEVEYFSEIHLQQKIDVTYALAGHAADGSRFLLRHEIYRPDGKLSARVTSLGGWMHLDARKLVAPPPQLLAVMNILEKTEDFVDLPSSIKPQA